MVQVLASCSLAYLFWQDSRRAHLPRRILHVFSAHSYVLISPLSRNLVLCVRILAVSSCCRFTIWHCRILYALAFFLSVLQSCALAFPHSRILRSQNARVHPQKRYLRFLLHALPHSRIQLFGRFCFLKCALSTILRCTLYNQLQDTVETKEL